METENKKDMEFEPRSSSYTEMEQSYNPKSKEYIKYRVFDGKIFERSYTEFEGVSFRKL